MSPGADDTLYELLPAVYRVRDTAEAGFPLRTLLRAIASQVDEFSAGIGRLYDNWFIETCDPDLVPYFAELVGLSLGPALPTSDDSSSVGIDAIWRRRQVADAISDRRRKGTFSVLEQLAGDATGWPARAIELATLAMATQSVRFADVGHRRLVDVSAIDALDLLATPLSDAARLPDVRRLASHRTPGTNNPTEVAVWMWRLIADQVMHAPAAASGADGHYTFDQLGRELGLAVIPSAGAPSAPATDLDVATPITRRAMALRLEDYYGPARSVCVYRGHEPIPRSEILIDDLSRWRAHAPSKGHVTIDPELGRIAFPTRHAPSEDILVTCARLGIGAIGGGSYARPLAPAPASVYRVGERTVGVHRTIGGALKAWRDKKKGGGPTAVIEIVDDGVYREHLEIGLASGEQLEIRAAQGCRPIVIPVETDSARPDRLIVRGADDAADAHPPTLILDGIWVARHSLDLHGGFGGVTLRHCTLVPAGGLIGSESHEERRAPSLVVHGSPCPLSIVSSVVGRVRVESPEAGLQPLPLHVTDSVLDACEPRGRAVLGADERPAWVCLSLQRVTVLGGADVHSVGRVEDSILTAPLDCERRQPGEVRYSYIAPGSRTPKRMHCQPDPAAAPAAAARLVPRFDAVQFGQPAYARLAQDAAIELKRGAHDEGELGAYHDLWEPLRIADLRTQLREFAPVGIDIDIRLAT